MMHHTVALSLCVIISLTVSVAAQNSSSSSGAIFVSGCHIPDPAAITFCADLVTYPISNDFNDTALDQDARAGSVFDGMRCPVYTDKSLQCQLHFPKCTISSTNQTIIAKVCLSSCIQAGQNYDNNFCSKFNQNFPDECPLNRQDGWPILSTDTTVCVALNISSDNSSQTWKIILVTILCVIGFLLLV